MVGGRCTIRAHLHAPVVHPHDQGRQRPRLVGGGDRTAARVLDEREAALQRPLRVVRGERDREPVEVPTAALEPGGRRPRQRRRVRAGPQLPAASRDLRRRHLARQDGGAHRNSLLAVRHAPACRRPQLAQMLVQPRASFDLDTLQRCYTPFWWDSFSSWGPCGRGVHRPDADRATTGEGLTAQWLRTIREHPGAYLAHRLKHFNSELFFAVPLKHLRLTPEYRTDDPRFRPYEVFSPSNVKFDLVRRNPTTWPVTWLAWGAVLMLFLVRRPPTQSVLLARVLVVSALGYTLAYLFIGVATDIRYHYWSMLATAMATLLVLPHLARGFKRRNPVLTGGSALVGLVVLIGLVTRLLDFQGWVT